jgi:hypothetical protein
LPSIETTVEYSIKMMKKIQHENIRSLDVKQDALDDIYKHFDKFHETTVFQEQCRSWFKDGKIKNRIYLWPGCVCFGPRLSPNVPVTRPQAASQLTMRDADDPLSQDHQRASLRRLRYPLQIW